MKNKIQLNNRKRVERTTQDITSQGTASPKIKRISIHPSNPSRATFPPGILTKGFYLVIIKIDFLNSLLEESVLCCIRSGRRSLCICSFLYIGQFIASLLLSRAQAKQILRNNPFHILTRQKDRTRRAREKKHNILSLPEQPFC